ncbi:MAG: hypothetical protein ACK6D3_09905 [Planctomycetaceae bacterium]|jgi:hypothetical protein
MLRLLVLVALAALVCRMTVRLFGQISNREGWPKIRRTLPWLLLPGVVGTYMLFFPLNPFPVHRFHKQMEEKLRRGMTLAEVEAVMGGPEGHYGNPEFNSGMFSMEGLYAEEAIKQRSWSDDAYLLDVVFDAQDRVVGWHRRAEARRYFESPLSDWRVRSQLSRWGWRW